MVYGVFGGCYSDWYVVGYFTNRQDAEKIYFKDFIPLNRDGIYQQFDINGE